MRKLEIPSFKYYFPPTTVKWITTKVRELLESGDFLTLGRFNEEFEKEFGRYVGVKHAIAVANGTALT